MSQTSMPSPNCTVRIQCLLQSSSSEPTSLIVTPDNSYSVMVTTVNAMASNSFSFEPSKTVIPQKACNICRRLLYSFEEILVCRTCHGSYHWRCVKPETISHYGEHENYICEKCNDGTTSNSPQRVPNGGIKIKSTDSIIRDYRDFVSVPSKANSAETNVLSAIRYFEEKQQQSQTKKTTKISELDAYLPVQTNEREYHLRYDQYNDGSTTAPQQTQQQQQNEIEGDNDNDKAVMFQANYQYTPLKDFALQQSSQATNDRNNANAYRNSPSDNDVHQTTSRYGGGLRYTNHGFDPTVARLVEAPLQDSAYFTSPTVNNLALHNHQNHFISTTNLNINENNCHRQQNQQPQSSSISLAPYVSQARDDINDDSSVCKPTFRQQEQKMQCSDRHSIAGSDSGIVMVNSNTPQQEQSDENVFVERKLNNLVQQLGKQLENDAQKVNEKLESKLKKLEEMINQQTYVIRQQDEVIERLKSKILKIEIERDNFRDRLFVHEKREQDEKKTVSANETDTNYNPKKNSEQRNQTNRKYSDTSTTTDNNKLSTKKNPAPRVEQQRLAGTSELQSTATKLVKNTSAIRQRQASDASSVPSSSIIERPAASSRLDNIIRQTSGKDIAQQPSSNYSLAQVRRQDHTRTTQPISVEQQVVTSIHHVDTKGDNGKNPVKIQSKQKRLPSPSPSSSRSSSKSSVSSSNSKAQPVTKPKITTTNSTAKQNDIANPHRSLESLQSTPYRNNQPLRPTNKSGSLDFGAIPVQYDDPGSIYITPVEGTLPAAQSAGLVKGWLRKKNIDSILKRTERYYCVLTNSALLMYRNEHDTTPQKAINLRDSKVLLYDDPKHGSALELTWSNRLNDTKHYHLYVPSIEEAEEWVTIMQTVIKDIERKDNWRPNRMST
ncbi:unnamed protein product [Rotaria magnacalcarata]